MQGSFTSNTYNITGLLGRASFPNDSAKAITVPAFQRGYSWEKVHVSTFWEDVLTFHQKGGKKDAPENYFVGPIVILPGPTEVNLLDGQQRLATITILLAVIRDIARTKGQSGSDFARDIHRDLITVDAEADIFALTLGELDNVYFRSYVQEDPPNEAETTRLRSHHLIRQAKTFLKSQVENLIKELDPRQQIQALKALQKAIASQLKMVAIEVRSEDEAFLIFETLNDRGLRLAVPDLVLNHLMRVAHKNERKQVRISWNQVIENLGQQKVSTFLRHMWVSKYGDVKAQSLYREIRNNLENQGIDSLDFARLCAEESKNYVAITNLDKSRLGDGAYKYVEPLVEHLSAERTLPLLLSGLVCLERNDFESLARSVLTVVVRHSIFANLNPSELEDILYRAARVLRSEHGKNKSSASCLSEVKQILSRINPSREQITTGITETILSQSQASYIVRRIAEHMQATDESINLGENSLEHIFPESADLTEWPQANEMETHIWHIGNLSMLESRLNRRAGNANFGAKLAVYVDSNLAMIVKIRNEYSEWGIAQIQHRAKSFLPIIRDIWKEAL